jgi:hypothetical protein
MDGPREELLEQLAQVEGQLKVLAIVGFCGLGKTALAAQVYNTATGDGKFERHAWVCAAHKPPAEVLKDLLQKLAAGVGSSQGTSDIVQLCVDLRKQLDNKRYQILLLNFVHRFILPSRFSQQKNGNYFVVHVTLISYFGCCPEKRAWPRQLAQVSDFRCRTSNRVHKFGRD